MRGTMNRRLAWILTGYRTTLTILTLHIGDSRYYRIPILPSFLTDGQFGISSPDGRFQNQFLTALAKTAA